MRSTRRSTRGNRRLWIGLALASMLAAPLVTHASTQEAPGRAGTLWVTNTTTNDVTVFDAWSGHVVGTVAVGLKPIGVTAAPGTGKVYVSNETSDSVSVISKTTLSVLTTIGLPLGSKPHHLAHSPDGERVYVALFGTNQVAFIDTEADTATVHTAGPEGAKTHAVFASSDGTTVYVTNTGVNEIQALDAATGALLGPGIPVGPNPSEVVVTADRSRAYVSARDADLVEVVNLSDGTVAGRTAVGDQPDTLTLTPDGEQLVVALRGGPPGAVTVIDLRDAALSTASVVVGGNTTGHQALSPDGRHAFVTVVGGEAPGLAVVNLAAGRVVRSYPDPGGGSPHGIAYDPAGPDPGPPAVPGRAIVLVVDGLEPESVSPTLTPTLWSLIQSGEARRYTSAEGVMVSETNPNHAAMMTGTYGDVHGIAANFFYDRRTGDREPLEQPSHLLAETLFDAIERQAPALRTASVMGKEKLRLLFDCTRDATGTCGPSTDNPEGVAVTHVAPDFVGGASTQFDPDRHDHDAIAEPASGAGYAADNEVIDIVIDLVSGPDPPEFTFVNLGVVDGFQHLFGARTPEGRAAVVNADLAIGRLVTALRDHRLWEETALFVLADHSFQDTGDPVGTGDLEVANPVTPQVTGGFVALPELLGTCSSGTSFTSMSFGGSAAVVITDAGFDPFAGTPLTEAQAQCLRELRARALGHPSVADVFYRLPVDGDDGLLGAEHPEWRLDSPRLGELFLVATDRASFLHPDFHSNAAVSSNAIITGHHGSVTTMSIPFLIASGSDGLGAGTDGEHVARAVDIAPTVAALLGIAPPAAAQGRVLVEAFPELVGELRLDIGGPNASWCWWWWSSSCWRHAT